MENPIKYSDIVSPDVREGFDAWINQIKQLQAQTQASIEEMKKEIASLGGQIKTAGSGTNVKPQIDQLDKLREIYKSLEVDVDLYDEAIQALNKSNRERNRVLQLSTELERTREGSYDRLQAQYNTLKTLVNNMTQAERENTDAGKKMVEQLKEMYERMNMMQQATGKYQLQVGNYSKAISGLNIATTQVIRELPALANSPATFAIAISNNIPILMDYIGNVKSLRVETLKQIAAAEAAGEAEKAAALRAEMAKNKNLSVTKLLTKSIFSWQSGLVLLLTVLPFVLRHLSKKSKEQEKYNEILTKTIDLEEELADAELKAAEAGAKAASKAKTMYEITQDQTRAYSERLAVAKELQRLYPDYLGNMDAEVIVAGQAKTAYDNLTESLIKKARAQAYLEEITKLETQRLQTEIAYEKGRPELAKKVERAQSDYQAIKELKSEDKLIVPSVMDYAMLTLTKAQTELNKFDEKYTKTISNLDEAQEKLREKVSGFGLIDDNAGGSGGSRKNEIKDEIKDYYFDMWQSVIDAMEDGLTKQLAQLQLSYKKEMKQYEDIRAELLEKQKTADAKDKKQIETQLAYIEAIMGNTTSKYKAEREELLKTEPVAVEDEYIAEEDVSLIKKQVEQEKAVRNSAIYAEMEERRKAGEDIETIKQETNNKLLASDIQYWEDYLRLLTESGTLTIDEYNKIMERLNALRSKSTNATDPTDEEDKTADRKWRTMERYFNQSFKYMNEWIETRIKMAEIAEEAAQAEQDAAKSALDYELEARANGYANNVEYARKEYEEKHKIAKKAAQDVLELQKVQEAADTAQQISSLVTATASIWKAEGTKGVLGIPLAVAATAAMWGSFAAAKIKAVQLTKMQSESYGEGMSEYLDYGGSHASGHDIDFGVKPDGTRRRVERGEMIGVINKRNVRKYGVSKVSDIISSLNHGTFENLYGNAFVGSDIVPQGADLRKLEKGVSELVEQGGQKVLTSGGKTIIYYKNTKKIIS